MRKEWRKEGKLVNCLQGKEGCLAGLEWIAEGGSFGQMTKERLENNKEKKVKLVAL